MKSELKTSEEYVLNELKKARDELMISADLINKLAFAVCCQDDLLKVIRKGVEIHTLEDGSKVINFRPVFEKFEEEDFARWEDYLTADDEDEGEDD